MKIENSSVNNLAFGLWEMLTRKMKDCPKIRQEEVDSVTCSIQTVVAANFLQRLHPDPVTKRQSI